MALTVDFAAAVRRQGSITAQSTDADILAAGDMEIQARFLPMLREAGAEFGLRRVTLPIVNGRPQQMPDRAQISGVRLVQYVVNGVVSVLPQMQPEDDLGAAIMGTQPIGWFFDAAGINIVPSTASGSIRMWYYQAPAKMILSSDTTQTSEILTYTETTSLCTVTFNAATVLLNGDVVSARPSHHTVIGALVNSAAGVANWIPSTYTLLDSDRPVPQDDFLTLFAGDWVAPNNRTPFVPLPEELFAALVHRTAGVLLQAQGYIEESRAQLEISAEAEARAMRLLSPRADGNPLAWTAGISRSLGQSPGLWRRW